MIRTVRDAFKRGDGRDFVSRCYDNARRSMNETNQNIYLSLSDEAYVHDRIDASVARKDDPISPLDGVPISIKDNLCTRRLPTTAGSKMLENYVSPFDAHVVQGLENLGAIVIGTPRNCLYVFGKKTLTSFQRIKARPTWTSLGWVRTVWIQRTAQLSIQKNQTASWEDLRPVRRRRC